MKKSFIGVLSLLLVTALLVSSCGNGKDPNTVQKKGSSGKTLELLVVANEDVYTGDTKALFLSSAGIAPDGEEV